MNRVWPRLDTPSQVPPSVACRSLRLPPSDGVQIVPRGVLAANEGPSAHCRDRFRLSKGLATTPSTTRDKLRRVHCRPRRGGFARLLREAGGCTVCPVSEPPDLPLDRFPPRRGSRRT